MSLVSTDWVLEHINDPDVRILECSEDVSLYEDWHIPNALNVNWRLDLRAKDKRDYIDKEGFEKLMSKLGIKKDTMDIKRFILWTEVGKNGKWRINLLQKKL
jgi:thiosulfate/3-mercaptopyruvate sulfurtransferase